MTFRRNPERAQIALNTLYSAVSGIFSGKLGTKLRVASDHRHTIGIRSTPRNFPFDDLERVILLCRQRTISIAGLSYPIHSRLESDTARTERSIDLLMRIPCYFRTAERLRHDNREYYTTYTLGSAIWILAEDYLLLLNNCCCEGPMRASATAGRVSLVDRKTLRRIR